MNNTTILKTLFIAAVLGTAPANAGDFLFQWDNDKVADTDRHYTNGMRIGYVPDKPWKILSWSTNTLVDIFGHGSFTTNTTHRADGWVLGQDMYTPSDVLTRSPDPNDRPYAGWSYIGITALAQTDDGLWSMDQQDTIELDFGIVGPESRAGETQNWFHRQINVTESNGWDSQIGTEPGILLTRTMKVRTKAWMPWTNSSLGFDAIPHVTGQFGNIKIGASGGLTARFGRNLDQDFGPIYGTFALPNRAPQKFAWAVYSGAEVRGVVRDIFLNGNTFKDSPDVEHNPFVLEGTYRCHGTRASRRRLVAEGRTYRP